MFMFKIFYFSLFMTTKKILTNVSQKFGRYVVLKTLVIFYSITLTLYIVLEYKKYKCLVFGTACESG